MIVVPSSHLAAHLAKQGVAIPASGYEVDDGEYQEAEAYLRKAHKEESEDAFADRLAYFLIWRHYRAPEPKEEVRAPEIVSTPPVLPVPSDSSSEVLLIIRPMSRLLVIICVLLFLILLASLRAHGQDPVNVTKVAGTSPAGVVDVGNQAVRVNVVAGAAGGGVAQTQVRNAADAAWVNVGWNAGANLRMPIDLFSVGGTAVSGANVVDGANTAFRVNCVVGCAGAADTVGTTQALNAGGATANVALAGDGGVGVFIAAGTLAATVVPEVSYDGGTTYVASLFYDPAARTTSASLVLTNPNAATTLSILGAGGASHARVRVSAFTSGTANATLRATTNAGSLVVNQGNAPWTSSVTLWAGGTLGAMANYGTSPGAVLVPGVNAFVTSLPAVTGTVTANQGGNWNTRTQDGAGTNITSNSTTTTSTQGLDINIRSILNTAPSAAGKLDVKAADGDVFVRCNAGSTCPVNATLQTSTGTDVGNVGLKASQTLATVSNVSQIAATTPTFGDQNNVTSVTGNLDVFPVGRFNATQPTLTDGRWNALQVAAKGSLFVQPGAEAAKFPVSAADGDVIVRCANGSTCPVNATLQTSTGTDIGNVGLKASQTLATLTSITNKVGVTGADGDVFVRQATGTNLHAVIDTGSTTAVTQATGSNLHSVTDSGSVTAATLSAETTKVIGTVNVSSGQSIAVTQATGTNLHSVTDSGSVTAATLSAETTKVIGTVRALGNAGAAFDAATAAAVPANALYVGGNGSGNLTGLMRCDNSVVYDTNTNGKTQLVGLVSGKVVYVCGLSITQSTTSAVTVSLGSGTGTNCGTTYTAKTPAWPIQAPTSIGPTGLVLPLATAPWFQTAASEELCISTNAAVSVQVLVSYTQF